MGDIRIGYICDQYLPRTSTDTQQIVSMISAFGLNSNDITLVLPVKSRETTITAEELAQYYEVEKTFKVSCHRVTLYPFRGLVKILFALKIAVSKKYIKKFDVIYSRNLPVVLAFLLFTDKPVVYETYRNWPDQNKLLIPIFNYLANKPNFLGIVTHSKFAGDSYAKIGISAEKLLISHNGIWPDRFARVADIKGARKKISADNNEIVATYSGRVSQEKGLNIILRLARHFPDVTFWIVGSEQYGTIEKRSEKIKNIKIFPWQPSGEVPLFLSASDILIIPTSAKPLQQIGNTVLPMKTFGYMASKRPILAPKIPDIEEILVHNKNALLVEPDNFESLKKQFQSLIDNPGLGRKLADQAYKDVINMSWENRARKIETFIKSRLDTL